MCDCKCQHPEKLKDKPENCTPDQVEECHGKKEDHGCICGSEKEAPGCTCDSEKDKKIK